MIYDGHTSHLSIEVIEKARENDIHFLCLPSHCTHLLQPLDVSVMSSLKMHFGKACKQFLSQNTGRVITEGDLASLVGQAWPVALTPSNLISGFCKSGIYPLNPGRITDRHIASHGYIRTSESSTDSSPQSNISGQSELSCPSVPSQSSVQSSVSNSGSVDDVLILPRPKTLSKNSRAGLTTTTQCTTDSPFLQKLKGRKAMRVEREREKIAKNTKKPKPRSKAKIRSPERTYRKKTAAAQNKKTTSARKTAARLLARSIQLQ